MKNKNNIVSRMKLETLIILTILIVSCGNKTGKTYNNPIIKINKVLVSDEYFKFKGGKYYLQKSLNMSSGNMTIFDKIKEINVIDSTDLPNVEAGEYKYIIIEFVSDKYINLKIASFSKNRVRDYNIKENWINKCEIVDGSRSIFDKGDNIKLKWLNCDESDLSNSVLIKGTTSKKLDANPQKSNYIIKTTDYQIVCNKREIFWKTLSNHNGEFTFDPEFKEIHKKLYTKHPTLYPRLIKKMILKK